MMSPCVAFLEDAEALYVGGNIGVARALVGEVRRRADAAALEPRECLCKPLRWLDRKSVV